MVKLFFECLVLFSFVFYQLIQIFHLVFRPDRLTAYFLLLLHHSFHNFLKLVFAACWIFSQKVFFCDGKLFLCILAFVIEKGKIECENTGMSFEFFNSLLVLVVTIFLSVGFFFMNDRVIPAHFFVYIYKQKSKSWNMDKWSKNIILIC